VPAGHSAIGGQEVIGAATSTGVGAATTSISPRLVIGPRIPSPAAATDGSRASTIGRPAIVANATSATTAVNRFSIPAVGLATDLALTTDLATGPARSLAVAETMLGKAIVTKVPTFPIAGKVHGRAQRRGLRIVRQARDRPIVEEAGNTSPEVVAVAAVACARAAAAVALWDAAAEVAVAVAAAAVVADAVRTSDLSTTWF